MAKQPGDDECAPLTARLARMLWARGYGWSYDEIGILEGIKGGTVSTHLRKARKLLECETVEQAVEKAARLGIIDLTLPGPKYPSWMAPREEPPGGTTVSSTIRFVGGPADGQTIKIPGTPPLLYLIPLAPPAGELFADSPEPTSVQKAEYEPIRQNDRPCIQDDGTYLYQHRAAPLTADERRRLEDARREARAAEERRGGELDEAWREIRRERPHYPESWRDL
ncbi:helix-turn-helix transcriptional regulator [Streptomyces sp. NPDC006355]|uniref:helix-turn-helix transcriptional regulator n=1 Tax=Streptomyces sp. NPDC006355 TaxID=3156758 RepID=UPI0033AEFCF0